MRERVLRVRLRSVFYQVQQMFGQLLDSQLQCYTPDAFWDVFRLWGQAVNVREQQDAFDFYTAIIDQMDEQMKVGGIGEMDEHMGVGGIDEISQMRWTNR